MGTRPTKSFSKFVSNQSTAGDPSMRHIRPRVSTHAFDDMASSFGASPASIVPKPVRGPTDVSKDDSDVGQYVFCPFFRSDCLLTSG